MTKTTGAFDFGATMGTTYAADSQGKPCYFDFETRLEIDYRQNEKNSLDLDPYG